MRDTTKSKLSTFALAIATAIIVGGASVALAALNFSATGITGDGNVVIDSPGTISIGTSTATGITIGSPSSTVSFPGNVTVGSAVVTNQTSLVTPGSPAVTTVGVPGAASYSYKLLASNSIGHTLGSSPTTINTGNAALNGTNYNVISTSCTGNPVGTQLDVYRSASTGNPTSLGFIGSVACGGSLHDTGLAGDGREGADAYDTVTKGVFASKLSISSNGDIPGQDVWIGDQDNISGVNSGSCYGAQVCLNYNGTTVNRQYGETIQLNSLDGGDGESVTGNQILTSFDPSSTGNGSLYSFAAITSALGTGKPTQMFGIESTMDTGASGAGQAASFIDGYGSGTFDSYASFEAAPLSVNSPIIIGFQSMISHGTGQLAFDDEGGAGIRTAPLAVSTLVACASGTEGIIRAVTDSATSTLGAIVSGSGSNHVLAYCDGTNWTVMAK